MAGARTGASPRLVALEGHTAPESLAGKIIKLKPSHVLVVDAAHIGRAPGAWAMLGTDELDASVTSTHLIPLSKLASHLTEKIGCAVGFVGIQPGSCGVAVGLSAPVSAAVEDVADNIVLALAENRP
jgi:hydrogenase maturation protease